MARAIEKIYAKAYFEAVTESGHLTESSENTEFISYLLDNSEDFSSLLTNPSISSSEKLSLLRELFQKGGKQLLSETEALVSLLLKKGRISYLREVLSSFNGLFKEARGLKDVYITSAFPLSSSDREKIEAHLNKTVNAKTLLCHYAVDSSLIGGISIRIGDKVVDGSLKMRLKNLTDLLHKVQLH